MSTAFWSDDEVRALLDCIKLRNIVHQLCTVKRNAKIFGEIEEHLATLGYTKTAAQCRSKFKNLKRGYQCLRKKDTSGSARVALRFRTELNELLGSSLLLSPARSHRGRVRLQQRKTSHNGDVVDQVHIDGEVDDMDEDKDEDEIGKEETTSPWKSIDPGPSHMTITSSASSDIESDLITDDSWDERRPSYSSRKKSCRYRHSCTRSIESMLMKNRKFFYSMLEAQKNLFQDFLTQFLENEREAQAERQERQDNLLLKMQELEHANQRNLMQMFTEAFSKNKASVDIVD